MTDYIVTKEGSECHDRVVNEFVLYLRGLGFEITNFHRRYTKIPG